MAHARYKSLVDTFAAEIREGRLAPGTRLPTHRKLAAREGVALVTATRVYAELEAMGLVSGETGRGTFVRRAWRPGCQAGRRGARFLSPLPFHPFTRSPVRDPSGRGRCPPRDRLLPHPGMRLEMRQQPRLLALG